MSLMTMRINPKRKNAFLSDCFYFVWLGKYKVDIQVFKGEYRVFIKNFTFSYDDNHLPHVVSSLGHVSSKRFWNVRYAIDYFNLVCYTLINDFAITSQCDFDEFFDLQRPQGFDEWLPHLHRYFK